MIKQIRDTAEHEQHCTKSLAKNVIKINCVTPRTYRKLVRYFKDTNIFYHTYKLEEERAYNKYSRYKTGTICTRTKCPKYNKCTIQNYQGAIKRVLCRLRTCKKNNKEIHNIKALQNKILQIEPPRVNKHNIIQCMTCQQYGQSKSYCNKPFICVKCGGSRNCKDCKKERKKGSPARCALCGGNHPANYKGCEHYHNLINGNSTFRNNIQSTPPINTNVYRDNIQHSANSQQQRSYADATKSNTNQVEDTAFTAFTLTKFLGEFKGLFNQLLQQNSMILNMFTMLINNIN